MSVRVRTIADLAEAASTLGSERGAIVFGGGTLVMRAVNEGQLSEGTLIRVLDPALKQIKVQGSRVELGAQVTMAEIIRHRDLGFLHAPARAIGGPAIRTMATACRGVLYLEVPTIADRGTTIDPDGTDLDVHWRTGHWYRTRLQVDFTEIGGGLWLALQRR